MACSRFEYVKGFEQGDALLPGTYIVVRLDGRGFSRFTDDHGYTKPNDIRGLALMNQCAAAVLREWGDVLLAFGESDEYSFVFPRHASVFGRRSAKLATGIASLFAASFVFHWARFFPGVALRYPPAFDARCVVYPTLRTVCDYAKWRQVDAHVNALHNEAFWALVLRGGEAPAAAYARLQRTLSEQKHELLHGFGLNYSRLPLIFKRGTTLLRSRDAVRLLVDCQLRLDGIDDGNDDRGAAAGEAASPPAPRSTQSYSDCFQAAARVAGCGLDSNAWGVSSHCPARPPPQQQPEPAAAPPAAASSVGAGDEAAAAVPPPATGGRAGAAAAANNGGGSCAPAAGDSRALVPPAAATTVCAAVVLPPGVVMAFPDFNRACGRRRSQPLGCTGMGAGDAVASPAAARDVATPSSAPQQQQQQRLHRAGAAVGGSAVSDDEGGEGPAEGDERPVEGEERPVDQGLQRPQQPQPPQPRLFLEALLAPYD